MTTNDVVVASDAADAAALEQVRERYVELLGGLATLASRAFAAVGTSGPTFDDAHHAVLTFIDTTVRPQLQAAESAFYPAALDVDRARLLVEGLVGETRLIEQAADRVARGTDRVQIAAYTETLRVLLEAHLGKVADLLLPALAEHSGVSLERLVAQLPMRDGAAAAQPASAGHGHGGCGCGEIDDDVPELDVREVPHAIRHATVFGAFDAVPTGGSMILVAPHDPIPLLHQLAERSGGRIAVDYDERGPEAWRLRLTRV